MSSTLKALLAGGAIFVVGVAGFAGILAWADTSAATPEPAAAAETAPAPAEPQAATGAADTATHDHTSHHTPVGNTASGTLSQARFDPVLPPLQPGTVHEYTIPLQDVTMEIAPGVSYQAWTFVGGAPGPTI